MDESRLNRPIGKDTSTYYMNQAKKSLQENVEKRIAQINLVKNNLWSSNNLNIIGLMDSIERVLSACGGESKVSFIDVSRNFIKVSTRIPMKANLHPGLEENDTNNPRFHKVVTQILIMSPQIDGVRWVPTEEGAILIVNICLNTDTDSRKE